MEQLTLKNGLKPFDIYFEDFDEHETIYFNPADNELPNRLMECQKMIEERSKKLKPYEVDENGIPNADSAMRYFDESKKIVYDAIDYAFGNKVSDVIFKHCGAFAVVDGEYYILRFLDAITPILQKYIKKDNKAANANVNKYLDKYRRK